MTSFAEIAVDSYQDPIKKLFTYEVPENLVAKAGQKVTIPFGKRVVEGYIWKITREKPSFPTKEITAIKGQGFAQAQVKLAHWMSEYYLASPLDCLKCQIQGKGERVALGSLDKITTLLLVPYATQVKLRAALQTNLKGLLVGSRSAVFAQLPNLKKIIIEEPENWNYKDERSPYYHAKDVAKKRAELEGLEVEMRYISPRVEDLLELSEMGERGESGEIGGKKIGIASSLSSLISLPSPIKIIDLNREKAAGNFTFVSQPLEKYIKNNLDALVYVNSKELREKMKEELRKTGADKNKVEIYGPELFALAGKKAGTIFWTDVDTIFNLPDFRAHEKIVWTTQKLERLTQGDLYLQTSSPNHPLFKELENGNLTNFYGRELKAREELSLPPFSTLVKLSFTGKSSAKVNFEAEKLHEPLRRFGRSPDSETSGLAGVEISPPYTPYLPTPGKFQLNIAVKMRKDTSGDKLLASIHPDWKIEVDPESLL